MIIIQKSDFTGYWAIATNNKTEPKLQQVIDTYERLYIEKLLGKELAALFIADLNAGVPQTPIYETIFEPIITDECEHSKGIKAILLGLVYYHFVSEDQVFHSQSGVGINEIDTTAIQSPENAVRFAEKRWNDALDSYEAVQDYILDNLTDYPTYDGKKLKPKYSSIL